MKKLLFLITTFSCAFNFSIAQNHNQNNVVKALPIPPDPNQDQNKELKILPPSPSVAELGRYGLASAKLSDGAFETQISLYQYRTKNLTLPFSLAYSTNGLKVDKIASRVGMDWSLIAGGSVSRMVLGDPDESKPWVTYPANFPNVTGQSLRTFVSSLAMGNVETLPDIYNFNFNGYSGRFLYLNNQIVKLEQNSLDINKTYDGFEVTDVNGIKYLFKDTEKSLSHSTCGGHPYSQSGWIKNAWMLSQIIHPFGDTIFLKYKAVEFKYTSGVSQTYISNMETFTQAGCSCPTKPRSTKCISIIQNQGLLLDKVYSNSRGLITFNYIARSDVPGDSAINSITLYDATSDKFGNISYFETTPKKTFIFEYEFPEAVNTYNGSGGYSVDQRMYLSNFSECESFAYNSCKTYFFNYNDLANLPVRLTYAQDHFGYFNGKNNASLIPPPNDLNYNLFTSLGYGDRKPDWRFSTKGTLNKITYPTGGTDSVVYESHSVYHSGSYDCNDLNLSSNVMADGTSAFKKVNTHYSNVFTIRCDQTVDIEVANIPLSGTIDYPIGEYLTSACLIEGNDEPIPINPLCDVSGDINGNDLQAGVQQWKMYRLRLSPGTYRLMVKVRGPSRGYARFTFKDNSNSSGNVNISGLRVKKVITKASPDEQPTERKYYYSEINSVASSGLTVVENPVYKNSLYHTVPCPGDIILCVSNDCKYSQYSSDNFYSLYSYGGNHIYYTKVIEDLGGDFRNGYIEHNFYVAHDVNAIPMVGTLEKGVPLTNYGIFNGFEYLTKYYKNTGSAFKLSKEIRKNYHSDSRLQSDYKFYSFKADAGFGSNCTNQPNTLSDYRSLHVAQFDLMSRWIYVDSTTIIEFDDNGVQIKTVIKESYDNPRHQLLTKSETFNSKGESRSSITSYPSDTMAYANPDANSAMTSLESLHMYAAPLKTQSYIGSTLLKEVENEYSNHLLNVPVLSKTYETNKGGNKELKTEITKYGLRAAILGTIVGGSNNYSYLWDYNYSLPVAEVVNASSKEIAYTSFESDGLGNWMGLNSANVIRSKRSVTGTNYYVLNESALSKPNLINSNTYIVSYWSRSGSHSVSGTQPGWPKQFRTINIDGQSWTYWEHKVTGESTVHINGMGTIDELRLYPAGSQMTSYSYEPLTGITSQCDVNNHITYYEYDSFGRLKLIRDQDMNIIKTFCYNYSGQQENCGQ